jgi:gamma-glutamyltranspeptidase / glutathione hydrolase
VPEPFVPLATRRAPTGMVCSVDALASEAGVAVLRAGGSAADAAVATSAVLAVTTQHLCGMGGDLFALVHSRTGAPAVLNASGRAGSGADPERLRAEGATAMPPLFDVRSVPVPGCVDGWLALHGRFGRLPLVDVLAPAIGYAEDGFPVSGLLADMVPLVADLPEAADYTGPGPVRAGTIIRRPGLARSLRAIAERGRDGWYGGEFGERLLAVGQGEWAPEDLERPLADWVPPLGLRVWGHDVWTVPPNSQGYLTLAGASIAEDLGLPADPVDPAWAHLLVEAARAAGHDRLEVLSEDADGEALVAPDRLAARRAAVTPDRPARWSDEAYVAGDTIHLAVVDGERTGVSLIQSNAAGWGAHVVVPGVRVFLHNRGIGFSLVPGHPAEYRPGRRPPSTLSPALVTRPDGSLHTVLGTMGGDSQPQILLQLLARLLEAGQTPIQAVAAGRFVLTGRAGGFATWDDRGDVRVDVEGQAPADWAEGLGARGHRVQGFPAFDHHFGHAHVITVADAHLAGATDPRPRTGLAAGY